MPTKRRRICRQHARALLIMRGSYGNWLHKIFSGLSNKGHGMTGIPAHRAESRRCPQPHKRRSHRGYIPSRCSMMCKIPQASFPTRFPQHSLAWPCPPRSQCRSTRCGAPQYRTTARKRTATARTHNLHQRLNIPNRGSHNSQMTCGIGTICSGILALAILSIRLTPKTYRVHLRRRRIRTRYRHTRTMGAGAEPVITSSRTHTTTCTQTPPGTDYR